MLCFAIINSVLVSLLCAGFGSGQSKVCLLLSGRHHNNGTSAACILTTRDNNGTSAAAYPQQATTTERLLHAYPLYATITLSPFLIGVFVKPEKCLANIVGS